MVPAGCAVYIYISLTVSHALLYFQVQYDNYSVDGASFLPEGGALSPYPSRVCLSREIVCRQLSANLVTQTVHVILCYHAV